MSVSSPRVVAMEDYTVGWVCAIPVEMAAARGMLDGTHARLPEQDPADHNVYTLGQIQGHNVVVACLPSGITGTTSAATVAKDMLRTFKSIRFGLMVGIGGGAPSSKHDIRLGDIVVSQPSGTIGGVIQYDRGKALQGEFLATGSLNTPPKVLLAALASLQSHHIVGETRIPEFLSNLAGKNAKTRKTFSYPNELEDDLFVADYQHEVGATSTCYQCDRSRLVQRAARDDTDPQVHYGSIASGNQVIKNGIIRERLQQKHDVLCFEMEAAGLMLDFPCIVIRGISDYADSHKNDAWQGYAAATAAAFAKDLLMFISPTYTERAKCIPQLVSDPELHERVAGVKKSIRTQADEKKAKERREKYIKCHQAFKTSAYESFKNVNPDRVPGTCAWVLDHPQYRQWRQSFHDDLLWISADPGCGKSVLAKSLVDGELRTTKKHTVCYFFFKDNAGQVSLATALCALLHQLFNNQPELIRNAMDAFQKNGNNLQHEIDEMWRILLSVTSNEHAHSVTCVLDALDECSGHDRRKLIRLLTQFYSRKTTTSTRKSYLKFLATSRAYGDIESGFSDIPPELPTIRLAGERSNADITREITLVIQQKVSDIAHALSLDQEICNALLQKLQSTPHRTYLWLHLVMEELLHSDKRTKAALMRTINSLPETVEEAYENILKKHKQKHREEAQILLHIVVGARQPLRLSEMDVAFQLATDSRSAQSHGDLDLDKDHLESRLRNLCGLFIFVDNDRVYLIHQTAKEFLIAKSTGSCSTDGGWKESIDERLSNKIMTQVCVQYLSFGDVGSMLERSGREWREDWRDFATEYPLLHYSATYWPAHVRSAGIVDDELVGQITRVLYDDKHPRFRSLFAALWDSTSPYSRSHRSNGIHLALLHENTEILRRLLREPRQDWDAEDDDKKTALVLASSRGYNEIVEKLIIQGADINKQVRPYGHNALQAAIVAGHERTVDLLLHMGADIKWSNITDAISYACHKTSHLSEGWYLSEEASISSTDTTVQSLIEASTDVQVWSLGNPLLSVRCWGRGTFASELFRKRMMTDPTDRAYPSALRLEACKGLLNIVRMLLDKVTHVHFGSGGSAPLWEAAFYSNVYSVFFEISAPSPTNGKKAELLNAALGSSENRELLKQLGASMDLSDAEGHTLLYAASRTGDFEVIKFLLSQGARPNTAARNGQTPIHKAAQHGFIELLRLLEENGAVLDVADKDGLGPIHVASYFGQLEAVEFLLDHGVDINTPSNSRHTPLHAAAWKGHVDVVRLLLRRGANINSVDDVQRTPLYTAASKGRLHVVNKLLEKGADPGIRTLKNNTPLESAQHHGYKHVAEALLRHSEVLSKQHMKRTQLSS